MPSESKISLTELPSGTVTFLFTDIQGSTELLKQLGEDYTTLLADQRRILRTAFARYDGTEIDTQGDAFFASFPRATQAVAAVVEIQRALAAHDWPSGVEVRVRMGLHTGEPWLVEEGYVGRDVHRAARIAHVGHGGQVLLSETTAPLVQDELPDGVTLLDLGRHRLKDLRRPEHLHQLVIDGLLSEFPPLKSLEMLPPAIPLDMGKVRPPDFLQAKVEASPPPVFVGRERELDRLNGYLEQARDGQGGLVFITGGPGRGKTALMEAFALRSMETYPDLLVASGKCNAYTGTGDPYLPFREVMGDLTGDVEAKWAAGSISSDQAKRLWQILPMTAQSLVDYGPDLVEVFVRGKGLVSRASVSVPDQRGLIQSLQALTRDERATPGELEQKSLFEQYTQVLYKISASQPVLIMLDDLQWADAASINLLFHLGRRLQGQRILVVGAYRPEEVAMGRGEEKHPLESVLNEFKRTYGDVWIDLSAESPDEGRVFVEALLDSEPNRFSDEFREALFAHTGGHPLFTIELLRDLQERGDLVRDEAGRWVEGSFLDWEVLPARVEGVIEARIGRLEEELRELLSVASVEGEDFTAQVVAQVQELSERNLLRRLSAELEKRHRLVHARGEDRVGSYILSQYRFNHALFQQFMYNGLAPGERRLLHKEIAHILEELYAGDIDAIQVQLAHHYSQAGDGRKAVPYLLEAGDRARNAYAHQEAIGYYRHAFKFQEVLGDYDGAARTQMKLGQTYHSAFDYRRANEAYAAGFSLWRQASEKQPALPLSSSSQVLRLSSPNVSTLDPGLSYDAGSASVINLLFSGLLEYTPQMDMVPDLAHRWEIHEDGRKYIFNLREDAQWSDGAPLTAHDFVYAWRRLLDPAQESRMANLLYDIKGARAIHLGEASDPESLGARARDLYTLEVDLEAPSGYFLQLMANTVARPIPRHVVEKFGKRWTEVGNIVSNGPFLLENWQHEKSMTLTRNPIYKGRSSGNVQRVQIDIIPIIEWEPRWKMYQANELDVMEIGRFPPAEMNRLRRQRPGEYLSAPNQHVFYFVFNTSKAPFDDPLVRRAFVMALDREAYAQEAMGGTIIPALGGLIPPGTPGHSPEIGLPSDPDGAQKLLAQAGYPEGRDFPVVEILAWPIVEKYLENLISQWQDILGVDFIWDFAHMNIIPERARIKPPNMTFQGWIADYPDPDNFLRVGFEEVLAGWRDEAYERLVENARRKQDQYERIELYQQADKMLIDEAVVLPLIYNMQHLLVKPWLKNFPLSPMGTWFLKDVIIEPH